MTLEEAQERILELEGQLETVTTERDKLSSDNIELGKNLENARTLNQKLFDRLPVHSTTEASTDDEDDAPTCEEFAKTINI